MLAVWNTPSRGTAKIGDDHVSANANQPACVAVEPQSGGNTHRAAGGDAYLHFDADYYTTPFPHPYIGPDPDSYEDT